MGAKLKQNISDIVTLAADEIPKIRTFISHARHLKASAELIAYLWCIGLKRSRTTLGTTTQIGFRSAILPLERRYRDDRYFSMKWLNVSFAIDTLFSDVK